MVGLSEKPSVTVGVSLLGYMYLLTIQLPRGGRVIHNGKILIFTLDRRSRILEDLDIK